jgi:hypothetical protein
MRRITEILDAARDQLDAPGARLEFVRRLHAVPEEQDDDLTRLKEHDEIGFFA